MNNQKIDNVKLWIWTHNGLLKWQHYVCHIEKICKSSDKIRRKKNKNHQIKNLLVKCIETFLIYVFKNFKWHYCYKFYLLESISHYFKYILHGFFYQSHVYGYS